MDNDEILKRFEDLAGTMEKTALVGNHSPYGETYARASKSHAADVRNMCKRIRLDIRQE